MKHSNQKKGKTIENVSKQYKIVTNYYEYPVISELSKFKANIESSTIGNGEKELSRMTMKHEFFETCVIDIKITDFQYLKALSLFINEIIEKEKLGR